MPVIAWWVLPIAATLLAIVYVTWRGRPGPPEDTHDAMEAREAFRRAIEGGAAGHGRRARGRTAPAKGDDGDDADQRS